MKHQANTKKIMKFRVAARNLLVTSPAAAPAISANIKYVICSPYWLLKKLGYCNRSLSPYAYKATSCISKALLCRCLRLVISVLVDCKNKRDQLLVSDMRSWWQQKMQLSGTFTQQLGWRSSFCSKELTVPLYGLLRLSCRFVLVPSHSYGWQL